MKLHPCASKPNVFGNKAECFWPACNCSLKEISGVFHKEKIEWLVAQKIKDPKFKIPAIRF